MKVIFPKKRVGETLALQFDFTSALAAGVTLSSATTTASVYSGVDATPSGILSGTTSVSGTVATQKVTAGVSGTVYSLLCSAVTSDGQTLELQGFLAVGQDAV